MQQLRRMNVHHASLFPDLIGASDYCNILTAEAEQVAEIARQASKSTTSFTAPAAEPLEEIPEAPTATTGMTQSIEAVLRAPAEATQVEPGRIPLIAQELAKAISESKVVDWETRDAVQARLRNVVRVVLRKYGYPSGLRDWVAERVVEIAKHEEVEKEVL